MTQKQKQRSTGTVYNPTENQTQNGPRIHEKSKQINKHKGRNFGFLFWISILKWNRLNIYFQLLVHVRVEKYNLV